MSDEYRILVTGGRMQSDRAALTGKLEEVAAGHDAVVLRHGRCNPRRPDGAVCDWDWALAQPAEVRDALAGADWIAHLHALERGWRIEERPAAWLRYGNAAGSVRNQSMINEGGIRICIAAPDPASSGTWDCVRRAEKAGIPVVYAGGTARDDGPVQETLFR